MPIFHFNSRTDDVVLPDVEEEELPDIAAARTTAVTTAREALIEAMKMGDRAPDDIQVTDDHGKEVFIIPLARVAKNGDRF